ncbi:uncharacterized protein LOC124937404 [Impatiens glandulifera]|uniref:uncharacterized protein LOC124937404 n=1 Tax=Impatiens glandulifera TaxID=253017 RepID=UPI001FB066CB|nr:uncharacterized protein LOC124937404 [Impatiens glandulifera]XP_047333623.1 uncharacterized protein LOC124937404 [Impatiens glandulifera]
MPGLAQRNYQQFTNGSILSSPLSCSNGSISVNGFWSNHRDDISYNQLQKFWSDLSTQARQELLRIDKQTLFEQARRNMYCSRCNGLLLEGFLQIVMYGKSLQLEGSGKQHICNGPGASVIQNNGELCATENCQDEVQDPSVHPWGGLTSTKDGMLTLLDCYLYSKCLRGLQNVFDSARARERERELLYPDACGGASRGWISQGMMSYGRGHGTRETCALHTARLSVDTLVDFWSALGEETQHSLLRMKEEDFIERLMYRFDSKRFCRDCRRNVIREFKELKELKRMRRETRCSSWFCAADTAFQYEVSHDSVQADWNQSFTDSAGAYHHYEWAIGTCEGKSDILEFENAGTSGRVHVSGLNLDGLNACYITLRAWRMDGRCTELSVKAHALKGQQCVHCRLVVGDGYVTITRGENIRRFFEHAEEAEEEEDDDSVDKDGNELDGGCSRPQKHAKSPELAREFLVDAATVIFKEQVEKAFREGTARQNAHSIFVCLALKLLEERLHVACKEIITLEKQVKLLEEEEKEKREEEEKKERRRAKERDKKLRRKERLREKEKDKDKEKKSEESSSESSHSPTVPDISKEEEEALVNDDDDDEDSNLMNNTDEAITCTPPSPNGQVESSIYSSTEPANSNGKSLHTPENLKQSHRKITPRKDIESDPSLKWTDRWRLKVSSENGVSVNKPDPRNCECDSETPAKSTKVSMNKQQPRSSSKNNNGVHCLNCRARDRYDFNSCSCGQQRNNDYKVKVDRYVSSTRIEHSPDSSKPFYRPNKLKARDFPLVRKVWEPMESQKSNHLPKSPSSSATAVADVADVVIPKLDDSCQMEIDSHCVVNNKETNDDEDVESCPVAASLSGSDNCSSCPSEGDKITAFSSSPNPESSSSSSDSEEHLNTKGSIEEQSIKESQPIKANIISPQQHHHHQGMFQQIQNQRLQQVPIFQAPSPIGYYHHHHQAPPVPWTTAAHHANGLLPYPVFATPMGFSLNGNSHFMQYGSLHLPPPPSPLVSHSQLPSYQPIARSNNGTESSLNQTKIPPNNKTTAGSERNGGEEKNSGFSLFHFGGPAALSDGYNSNSNPPLPTKEEGVVGACDKKDDTIEEYNLFAAGNGIKFQFPFF